MTEQSKYKKVAVLYGGVSGEREISLTSGTAVYNALISAGVDATLLDWDPAAFESLTNDNFDAAFIMLHGGEGEDGTVQALLESLKIPYTGSGPAACVLAMDKALTKSLWQRLGVATLPFEVIVDNFDVKKLVKQFEFPICVKAASLGSSLGVYKVDNIKELETAICEAKTLDKKVIIEPWVGFREYTVGFLDNNSLPSIWIESKDAFYDYEAKYNSQSTQYHCPSGLNPDQEETIAKLAKDAFLALGCHDFGRVDFLSDKDGNFYAMEINTVPGMTERSLVPKAAQKVGVDFKNLVLTILNNASLKSNLSLESDINNKKA